MSHANFRPTPLILALLSVPCLAWGQANNNAAPILPAVTVQSSQENTTPALTPSLADQRTQLKRTPGGTNLIAPQEKSRIQTLQDALGNQPGITMQDFFGGWDQPRLSIRGSGIQSNPVNRGVLLLQDGLPLNEADGSFVISTLEPRNSAAIAVRRGANAENSSASTLGGELDFQSLVGDEGNSISINGGSFGRKSLSAGIGGKGEYWDGRIFFSHDDSNGFRHHSDSRRQSLHANAGWRSAGVENRTYLSYTDLAFDIPNIISKQRVKTDPKSVLGDYIGDPHNVYVQDPNRNTQQLRLANRTSWGNAQLQHTVGVYWQTTDDQFTAPGTPAGSSITSKADTKGLQWSSKGQWQQLSYRLGLNWAQTDMDRDVAQVKLDGVHTPPIARYDLKAENRSANLGLAWQFAPAWTAVGDMRYVQSQRDATNLMRNTQLNQQWSAALPKVGLLWQANANTQVFTNLSKSSEAPSFWEIVNGPNLSDLKQQRATTFEIGLRHAYQLNSSRGEWSASIYRSHVKDELMAINPNGGATQAFNYGGRTLHQGLELGIKGQTKVATGALEYQAAYTLNDFRFQSADYEGKRIAGVPRHLLQAEVMYRQGAWAVGPTLRWQPSDTETTHNNDADTAQDSYALWGLRMTYQPSTNWHAYLSVDNLTNLNHASAFVIQRTTAAAGPRYLSGNGRSVNAGVTYRF